MEKKYSILQVCVDLDGGGVDRYLYNYCTRIDNIHFDFVKVDRGITGFLEPLLEERGSIIYKVPRINGNIKRNYEILKDIMTRNCYDAVHVHLGYMGFLALKCARDCGIKTRIVHAHSAYEPENFKMYLKRKFFTLLTKKYATHLAACGIDAGIWTWGNQENVKVINNAILIDKYKFSESVRDRVRKEMQLNEETLVFANVGRIGFQKNQQRLLEIFAEIKKTVENCQLWLIGNREYSDSEWEPRKKELGIENDIKELGVRTDVQELLNAMDVFVFPSRYEGLPFALVETQCNGLPCLCADTVTKYLKVGENLEFLSLEESNEMWASKAINLANRRHDGSGYKDVVEAGFDLDTEAKILSEYYIATIMENVKK